MTRTRIDGPSIEVAALVAGLAVGVWLHRWVDDRIGKYFSDESSVVLGALVGLQGTLLGFVLAALTIVLGYQDRPQLAIVRENGQLKALFRIYFASIRAHALATVVALLAIIVNAHSAVHPLSVWLVVFTSGLAFLRLGRTLWVTKQVVDAITTDLQKAPGKP